MSALQGQAAADQHEARVARLARHRLTVLLWIVAGLFVVFVGVLWL